MKKDLKAVSGIFPIPVLMIGTYNEAGTIKLNVICKSACKFHVFVLK